MRRFQNIFKFLTPSWLHADGTDGHLVLASLALIKDAFLERAEQGLNARFPTRTGASALALTGEDRGLVRGRSESDEQYARRLIGWRYPRGHRTRGSAFALLGQIGAYWGDALDAAATLDVRGNYHARDADGTEAYAYNVPFNWDGAPATPAWGRFWVVLEPSVTSGIVAWPDFDDPALWGGSLNPDVAIGQAGVTPHDVRTMRRLFVGRAWKPAGTRAEWMVINLDGSATLPDGTWGTWSRNVGGTQTATRHGGWRYWALSDAVNVYSGDPNNYPGTSDMPGGGTYSGDPDVFPSSSTLPDGSTYSGDPATFTASVRLIDDGSPAA